MIWTKVDAVSDVSMSAQFTSIPFGSALTGLISSLDINGREFSAEILEKVKLEFASINGGTSAELDKAVKIREYVIAVVSPVGIREKLHSRRVPVVVHINSS